MASKFKKGDQVQQVMPAPVSGTVDGFMVDQETGDLLVHVVDASGETPRYFKEEELQAVPTEKTGG